MKTFQQWSRLAVACILGVSASLAFAGAKEEVDQAEDARYNAMIAVDVAAFDAMLGDEFVYHQPSGKVVPKKEYVEALRSGGIKLKKAERYGVTINAFGDFATAMGSTRVDVELNGEFKQLDLRYLNVWARRDGRWQLIARQSAYKPK